MTKSFEFWLKILENKHDNKIIMPSIWYHGSNKIFDSFDKEKIQANFKSSSLGFYFTQYLKPPPYGSTAREYANDIVSKFGGEPIIYECELIINNPYIIETNGWPSSVHYLDTHVNELKRELEGNNYDSIICYDPTDEELEYQDFIAVIFESNQIKINKVIKLNNE